MDVPVEFNRPELRSLLKWVISDPIEIKIKIG